MEKLRTDISVYCMCGERLYGPGSWTDFKEDAHGNLEVTLHVVPCAKCGQSASTKQSSVEKEIVRGGWTEVVKVGG
jgi:hypothetical protein